MSDATSFAASKDGRSSRCNAQPTGVATSVHADGPALNRTLASDRLSGVYLTPKGLVKQTPEAGESRFLPKCLS